MDRQTPLVTGELYHVYNRGAHKNAVYTNDDDYARFTLLLHLANSTQPLNIASQIRKGRSFADMLADTLDHSLVDLHAYCLMPNHFHMVLRQKTDAGISRFLKKLLTGYSMYFNTKYDHTGVLFQGRFKSSHINNDAYFRWIYAYVHLNPLGLVMPEWAERKIIDTARARAFVTGYKHSSFYDYFVGDRPEGILLSRESAPDFLSKLNDLEEILGWYEKDRPFPTEKVGPLQEGIS